MKSGGLWNFGGSRPETREPAQEPARGSDASVGDWLNSVIRSDKADGEQQRSAGSDQDVGSGRRERAPQAGPEDAGEGARVLEEARLVGERARDEARAAARAEQEAREAERAREEARREVERARDDACREVERMRDENRVLGHRENHLEAARNREEVGELHGRLDQISTQLERLAHSDVAQRRLALRQRQAPPTPAEAINERVPRLTGMPQARRRTGRPAVDTTLAAGLAAPVGRPLADDGDLQIEQAIAEIAARQRVLNGEAPTERVLNDASPITVRPSSSLLQANETSHTESVEPGSSQSESARLEARQPNDRHYDSPPVQPLDFNGLQQHLRQIVDHLAAMRPASDLEKAIAEIRAELAEIGRSLTGALPQRAVESLEAEVRALAQRIDQSRQCGADPAALASLERRLTDVHEALCGLTTAEGLVGVAEAVMALSKKIDAIAAREDPAALQQLEAAIGGLRGIVSHVASNDALTRVAEDVRMLSAKVDALSSSAASGQVLSALEGRIDSLTDALNASSGAGHAVSALESRIATLTNALNASTDAGQAVSALENRIDTLANALTASTDAGQAVPKELERLLAGLIEKLEWVQLTHTDHAALAHLEDRIAMLVKRFDASDARFIHLDAVERGLADLLVHIEQLRGAQGKANGTGEGIANPADVIERDVAEIRKVERRTQESLEAVQGTIEHVVGRLAMIESEIHGDKGGPVAAALPVPAGEAMSMPAVVTVPAQIAATSPHAAVPRQPLDPDLPPDHPLEPGFTTGRSRQPSAADRIAASEAVLGAKPPVIPDPGGKPDFIAAARRAAQAAAATEPERQPGTKGAAAGAPLPKRLSERLRKLIVPISVLVIVAGGFRIASPWLLHGGSVFPPGMQSENSSPIAAELPEANAANPATLEAAPFSTPGSVPAANADAPQSPDAGSGSAAKDIKPAGQSVNDSGASTKSAEALPADAKRAGNGAAPWPASDVTGSLPGGSVQQSAAAEAGTLEDRLPATIGGPALRAAALSGDASAAYEVAVRFAEGHGVPQNNEEAARWLERAANAGLTPAQFRLGALYEKGIGVKKNLAAARDLYRAAAEKGHAKAMHNLAVLYAEGVNGAADYHNAAQWFRKAADHGVADSQYNLGILYARGTGMEQNFAESYKWFALAANHGDKDAAKKRDEVATHLDQQGLAAARLAAHDWTAEPHSADAVNVTPSDAWDAPASAPPVPRPKPRAASIKPPPADAAKIN